MSCFCSDYRTYVQPQKHNATDAYVNALFVVFVDVDHVSRISLSITVFTGYVVAIFVHLLP